MAGVVLVHGAWHGPWCWAPLVDELERRGVRVEAVDLPLTGFSDDVRVAREVAEAAGQDTVLVGHSYGGMVISEAAANLATVRRLVYVAALMSDAGEDATAIFADGSLLIESLVFTASGVTVEPGSAREIFYGDSDVESASKLVACLRPMPLEPIIQGPEPAWKSIPSTYVVCTNDRVLQVETQRRMAARADETVELDSDHSPFVLRSGALADVLVSHLP